MIDRVGLGRCLRFFCASLLVICLFIEPATAQESNDPGDAAARATVRIISLDQVEGGINYSTGTGVVVTKRHVVTNHHVVRDYLESGGVVVVPSFGREFFGARVTFIDPIHDLALLEVQSDLPTATIATSNPRTRMPVLAFGYPGNLDRVFAESLRDLAVPAPPAMPPGAIIDFRSRLVDGERIPEIVHNAPIGPGFSGGPVLDECGRVIGVNRAVPNNKAGDAQYGFTIPASLLIKFLSEAGVEPAVASDRCVTQAERVASESGKLRDEMARKRLEEYQRERERLEEQRARETYLLCREEGNDARLRQVLGMAALMLAFGGIAAWAGHVGRRTGAVSAALLAVGAAGYGAYVLMQRLDCELPASGRNDVLPSTGSPDDIPATATDSNRERETR